MVFLSCYFLVQYGVKLGLTYALELNLDRIYVLGLELESCFLISSSTENQSMSSCFISERSNINELLSKVMDCSKALMTKLLTEVGEEASMERFEKKFILSCIIETQNLKS